MARPRAFGYVSVPAGTSDDQAQRWQKEIASYVDHDHEALREMMTDPNTVLGLSDGGAHCGTICDAASPTLPSATRAPIATG